MHKTNQPGSPGFGVKRSEKSMYMGPQVVPPRPRGLALAIPSTGVQILRVRGEHTRPGLHVVCHEGTCTKAPPFRTRKPISVPRGPLRLSIHILSGSVVRLYTVDAWSPMHVLLFNHPSVVVL